MTLTDAQLGWVAGVLDLRGYLSERPSSQADRRLPTVAVTLAAVDGEPHPVISWLCRRTGVQPIPTGKGYNRTSCGVHCPEPHTHVSATYHRWIVGGAKAQAVLASVLPYLLVQRKEAQRLMRMGGQYKRAHMADMARRGWPGAR